MGESMQRMSINLKTFFMQKEMHVKYVHQFASNVINYQNVLKLIFNSRFELYYHVSTF